MPNKSVIIWLPVVLTCAALKQHLFAINEEYGSGKNSCYEGFSSSLS